MVQLARLEHIVKDFGAVRALDNVSLDINQGEVLGLMGDNGAGKSTLVKTIAGNFQPTSGTYYLEGKPVTFHGPADARRQGIEVVYQDLAICDNLTAAANVFLGREMMRQVGPLKVLDHRRMNVRAAEIFRELKSETRPADLVVRMSGGQRQAVAIARTRLAQIQDRADGRAHRGHQRATGRGSAGTDPPHEGAGSLGDPDQPPHARRLRGL